MAPNQDIGWDHTTSIGNDRKVAKCNYCGKLVHGRITRMKQHIAHVAGQVEACPIASTEIRELSKKHLIQGKNARAAIQRKKESLRQSINLLVENEDDDDDDIFELNEEKMEVLERKQYKRAMEKVDTWDLWKSNIGILYLKVCELKILHLVCM